MCSNEGHNTAHGHCGTLGGAALVPGCQVAPCWGYMDIMGPPAAKFTDYYVLLTLVLG